MRLRTLIVFSSIALLSLPAPASAHDLLIEIDPKDGAVITSSTFEATLIFNNPLLVVADKVNAELSVKIAQTEDWVQQEIGVDGNILRANVVLFEPGEYDLRWKVVSSDGHPITGESTFKAEFEVEPETEEPVVIAPNPISETQSETGSLTGFYIGLAMVALGAVFAPIGLMLRRRAKKPRA